MRDFSHNMELDTVIGSDLRVRRSFSVGGFDLDNWIKQYLLAPDLSLISKIKIGLRYYITAQPDLILQLNSLKQHLNIPSLDVFYKCYTRDNYETKEANNHRL